MTKPKTKRVRIGDVIEIATEKGFAYAQYTHKESLHGSLLRVFPGLYSVRPNDLETVIARPPRFSTFFPLQAAVDRGTVLIVGNLPVPDALRAFPLFRVPMRDIGTGKVQRWWFWDGENEWPVGALSGEQRKIPIRAVWNDTLLIERIVSDWTPETDSE